MSQKHSKEPWREGKNGWIVCDSGANQMGGASDTGYYGGHLVAESVCPSDRRRIIACVNVLAGVPTDILEQILASGGRFSVTGYVTKTDPVPVWAVEVRRG